MMMKSCAILALAAVYVYAAPTGLMTANVNADGSAGTLSASGSTKVRGFKAVLYLFAPDTWIQAFNATPADGQECFLTAASDPANQDLYNGDDVDAIKKDLQTKCPSAATQLGVFADQTAQTMKALPAKLLTDSKAWGEQMKALGEQVKQIAAANSASGLKGEQAASAYKPVFQQFASQVGDYLALVAAYPDADRQQISAAFPKLQAFFSGDQATTFLKQASDLYKTLGSANPDINTLKTQGQQIKQTFKTIWQQYSTQNADGLKQASALLGQDLSQVGTMLNAQMDASAGTSGISGMGGFASAHPQLAQMINEGTEKSGKDGLNDLKENFNDFKQNTKDQWSKLNGNADNAQNAVPNFSGNANIAVQ